MVQGLLDIMFPTSSLAATNIPLALNGGGGCDGFGFGLEDMLLRVRPYLKRWCFMGNDTSMRKIQSE